RSQSRRRGRLLGPLHRHLGRRWLATTWRTRRACRHWDPRLSEVGAAMPGTSTVPHMDVSPKGAHSDVECWWMGPHRLVTPCVPALALGGCPTVDLGATPSDIGQCNPKGGIQYFMDQIWPNYIQSNGGRSCIDTGGACHAENGGNVMTFKTNP